MSSPLRTVIVDSDPEARATLRRLAATVASVAVVGECASPEEAARSAKTLQPDILLAEVPGESAEPVQRLTRAVPEAAILAMVASLSPAFVVQVMRAGAFEVVSRPVLPPELVAALDKLARFRRGATAPPRRMGRIVSVFSPKGGLGATTLAVNLAVCLAEHAPGESLLVELNTWQSDAVTFLDLRPRYSVTDALGNIERLDESFLQGLLVKHPSGLAVLPAPALRDPLPLSRERVQAGLELIRAQFAHVVLDLWHGLDEGTAAALEVSDTILLLTTANVSALRWGGAAVTAFRHLGLDLARVRAVLMRDGTGEDVTPKHASEALGLAIAWKIPNDYRAVVDAINAGRPVVSAAPRSKIARSLRELAETLPGLAKAADKAPTRAESLLRLAWPARPLSGAG
jgi:pilus assembly protein CpaE